MQFLVELILFWPIIDVLDDIKPFKHPTVVTTALYLGQSSKAAGIIKNNYLNILRTRNRPPKVFQGKSLEAINFKSNDLVGVSIDLIKINFEKSDVKLNGIQVNLEPTVSNDYSELKNNPSKVNDY